MKRIFKCNREQNEEFFESVYFKKWIAKIEIDFLAQIELEYIEFIGNYSHQLN